MTDYKALCAELAALAKRNHYYCEDSWHSCPKAEDGCADDSQADQCNCGADAHNAKVDALLNALAQCSGRTAMSDFRDLCAELLNAYEHELNKRGMGCDLINRARAALAEPEPEQPTVMEIIELANEIEAAELGQVDLVRAALARWGNL
jgi:hypothetical protein